MSTEPIDWKPFDPENKLRVFVFNVNQGDQILLQFSDHSFGIIDLYYNTELGQVEPPAISFLKAYQKQFPNKKIRLQFLCLSHPDLDHIKGTSKLNKWLKAENKEGEKLIIEKFWSFGGMEIVNFVKSIQKLCKLIGSQNGKELKVKPIESYIDQLEDVLQFKDTYTKEENRVNLKSIRPLNPINGERAYCLGPLEKHIEAFNQRLATASNIVIDQFVQDQLDNFDKIVEEFSYLFEGKKHEKVDKNLLSSILLIQFVGFKLLFGGDTHLETWNDCINFFKDEQLNKEYQIDGYASDFLKASHHGSRSSSSEDLFKQLLRKRSQNDPQVAISAGLNLKYKHPHQETIDYIRATGLGAKIHSTNACHKCDAYPLQTVDMDSIFLENSTKKKKVIRSMNSSRLRVTRKKGENLAALIYEFDPDTDSISVFAGITSKWNDLRAEKSYSLCSFNDLDRCSHSALN